MAAPLKDLFNKALIVNIALEISKHYPNFHSHNFISSVLDCDWESLKLKERIKHIAIHLKNFLPSSYSQSINVLKKTAPNFTGFEYLMFADYVELYGLKNFKKSFEALECFTQCSTGEFAIRKFILHNKLKTMRQLKKWSTSDNEHIRRLASEGCRPRLPWGVSLVDFKKDPDLVLEILEILKKVSSKYVQKSVANNLNDISKDNPNKVLQLYSKWDISNPITRWILKHGSRSLLKKGNPKALIFFGYHSIDHISVEDFICDNSIKLGRDLLFSFKLRSNKEIGNIRLEYFIDFLKKNNKYSSKIFKISESDTNKKNKLFNKKHSFKIITTRKYYIGIHYIRIVLNGQEIAKKSFNLKK